MANYEIIFKKSVYKDLRRLPKNDIKERELNNCPISNDGVKTHI